MPQKMVGAVTGQSKALHPRGASRLPLSPIKQDARSHNVGEAAAAPAAPRSTSGVQAADWVLRAEGAGSETTLSGSTIWVGRWKERVGLWLDDGGRPSKASRLHARLEYSSSSGVWSLTDNKSANGTFVNGERLRPDQAVELSDGDRLGFGTASFLRGVDAPPPKDVPSFPRFHFVLSVRAARARREAPAAAPAAAAPPSNQVAKAWLERAETEAAPPPDAEPVAASSALVEASDGAVAAQGPAAAAPAAGDGGAPAVASDLQP